MMQRPILGRTLEWLTCAGCPLCHKHCTRWLGRLSHWTILRALWCQCQNHQPHSTDKNPGQELIRILGDEAWVKPDSLRASYCSWPPFHTGALNLGQQQKGYWITLAVHFIDGGISRYTQCIFSTGSQGFLRHYPIIPHQWEKEPQ